MPMDTCIRTRKIIKCSILIDSYLHHVYVHAKDYFTERQSTLPFRGIDVVGIEAFICIYGKLLFPKQYVHPFFDLIQGIIYNTYQTLLVKTQDVASPIMINTLTLISGFGLLIYSGQCGLVYYLSM
jgi:hypothetical protein